MRLSQRHLNLLSTCPRKFQHTYLEQLGSLTTPEQLERINWGSHFHLLMQQRELGLPIESIVQEDAQMQRWLTALVSAAPEILTPSFNNKAFRESEHWRVINLQGYVLTVIYDLLIADDKKAQILDWKTYPLPKNRRWLEEDWQTRLYLYVLAETSDYSPEQISMTYWFVQSQPEPKSLQFSYNAGKHEQTRRDLIALLNRLNDWLASYERGEELPQVPLYASECDRCQFAVRCDRTLESNETETNEDLIPNLVNIQEVSL
ncbi:PD-(D/E)XK nuclease family protein [Aerosakkonema funiforme]|uniref:PD-(D/E)XK nuclease family protein n=2 Tax=Oscillatoriophycideae TaxID=1301283 RepID=A0A926VDI1_9CYAN|nr:PD-(D/E)XK nuclease family protein [Aerosakkonema funiforme]MBD2181720.1 PD-(D/E)XK nuclease family protein [Aerosakkonema funiforme FACHB-1375]